MVCRSFVWRWVLDPYRVKEMLDWWSQLASFDKGTVTGHIQSIVQSYITISFEHIICTNTKSNLLTSKIESKKGRMDTCHWGLFCCTRIKRCSVHCSRFNCYITRHCIGAWFISGHHHHHHRMSSWQRKWCKRIEQIQQEFEPCYQSILSIDAWLDEYQ